MNKEKLEYFSRLVIVILGVGFIAYIFLSKLIFLVLPFLISWATAFAVRPLSNKIGGKVPIPRKWIRLVLSLLFLLLGISAISGILIYAGSEAWAFLSGMLEGEGLYDIISGIMNPLHGIFGDIEGGAELENHIAEAVRNLISSLLERLVGFISGFVSSVPRALIFALTLFVSLVYFSLELESINEKILSLLPKRASEMLVRFKNRFMSAGAKYIKAYFIITLTVFLIILVGLLILRVKYAVLLALVFAFLDILPLIGVGTFIVPWSVIEIVRGNLWLGIGLIVLLVVTELIRNLIEPRIVGKNLGIHPIVSLVLLYLSFSVFGIAGLLLMPILTVCFNILFNKDNSSKVE